MKLYKFSLSTWRGTTVSRTVLEVEEKPKTYIEKKQYYSSRILKSDVGVLSGYGNNTLYMLEDDMEKAKSMFAESLKRKIESEKLASHQAIIRGAKLEQYEAIGTIDEFKALKENQCKCEDCAGCTVWKCDCENTRQQAIDEFVKKICEKYTEEERKGNYKQYCAEIKQNIADIAEQLKG